MDLLREIELVFAAVQAVLKENKGLFTAEQTVAERKTLLSRKKLVYVAKFRIDETRREVRFTEMLKETGFGLSGGGDMDSGPGFGFKSETHKVGSGPRQGTIEEQSRLFGKRYTYTFDFNTVRGAVEKRAQEAGFAFKYQITAAGM
jgi:hypothetical protein